MINQNEDCYGYSVLPKGNATRFVNRSPKMQQQETGRKKTREEIESRMLAGDSEAIISDCI